VGPNIPLVLIEEGQKKEFEKRMTFYNRVYVYLGNLDCSILVWSNIPLVLIGEGEKRVGKENDSL
jgi:hypothetical protein